MAIQQQQGYSSRPIRLMVQNKAGSVILDHTFDYRLDEPKLDYDFIKEDYARPTKMENGKLETYEWGYRLIAAITFYADNPGVWNTMWQNMIYTILNGGKIYFGVCSRLYEVYLTPESRRQYENGFMAYINCKLDFIGINLLDEVPNSY